MTIDRRRKNSLVGHGRSALRFTTPGEAFGADGACALYRAETLHALGPEWFDERMALWATDADLAWRAQAHGWRCAYEPAAIARHIRTYSPSTRATASREHRRIQFRNRLLMIARNETPAGLVRDGCPDRRLRARRARPHAAARAVPAARLRGSGAGGHARKGTDPFLAPTACGVCKKGVRPLSCTPALRAHPARLLTVSRARIPRASWSAIVHTTV